MKSCCRWSRRLTRAGAIRVNVSFSTLNLSGSDGGRGVSKGHALEAVAQAMGYSLKECIAFGDGMNDAEMLHDGGQRLHHGQCAPASERPVSRT
ncbi:putative hydrolase of the HAD superfamily [Salmonella enterica subsp. enterica]|uniref:Putative hydrolase of the HAD superfamily n=1 Tax=Salmonella enterica I TaxID=59201 RepID=A0A379X5F7_SALET|nr:putative hydrolase of the HAD superfamily [Salmonella enterica subsp. enterica]